MFPVPCRLSLAARCKRLKFTLKLPQSYHILATNPKWTLLQKCNCHINATIYNAVHYGSYIEKNLSLNPIGIWGGTIMKKRKAPKCITCGKNLKRNSYRYIRKKEPYKGNMICYNKKNKSTNTWRKIWLWKVYIQRQNFSRIRLYFMGRWKLLVFSG